MGAAYIFESYESSWSQQAELRAFDGEVNHGIGSTVALAGSFVAVGSLSSGISSLE